jgi:flagellar FliL protein
MAEETTQEEQLEAPAGKKSNSLMLIIIIVVLILIIIIGGIIAVMMMGSEGDKTQMQQNQTVQERPMQRGTQGSASALAEIGPMFPLDTFTVNLLSESGRRYLKVEMNLELSGEELGVELDNKTAVIRDIIIRLLSSKSLEEISTAKGKEKLKEQIVDQLNMRLRDGRINNVYFTEFVVQ